MFIWLCTFNSLLEVVALILSVNTAFPASTDKLDFMMRSKADQTLMEETSRIAQLSMIKLASSEMSLASYPYRLVIPCYVVLVLYHSIQDVYQALQ